MQIMQLQSIQIRLKFTKEDEVKYISHLDLMRTFQRVIRRADIPIAYSSGFNPHQELSFGAPLALGVTSHAEYVDIKLDRDMPIAEIVDRLNANIPKGIRILGGAVLGEKAKPAMSIVTHSRFTIRMKIKDLTSEMLQKKIDSFLENEKILVMKEQPKKNFALKEIDIKPMIVYMQVLPGSELNGSGNEYFVNCLLQNGSRANLNPELLMKAFIDFTGYEISGIKVNREELYAEKDGKLVDLLEAAKEG